ncbi:RNA 2'-phosphotransferase [uncultured Erythrobacter sp.]|uniref:RNA 2'-phosphotransferase n=1 Tax=uncultured Erythrobacter sp. TaxID=263913 RepID=UPI00260B2CBD|nr:RNA 2'-phosphotransferase [uncultured Erythrobacter sp.]
MSNELKKRSKSLSYWLRHRPDVAGLELDEAGWASVEAILKALSAKGLSTDAVMLERVVAENDKQRFELSDDGTRIRARQGHSVAVEGSWETATPPETLFHGTVEKFMPSIERDGLTKQNRHHVHLSPDLETATKVGQRRGKPVILEVDAKRMTADGVEFALSSNNVWLVEEVPPRYFKRMPNAD